MKRVVKKNWAFVISKPVNKKVLQKLAPTMLRFITEIQEALTDKKKGGTPLSVQETGMLHNANEILNQVK